MPGKWKWLLIVGTAFLLIGLLLLLVSRLGGWALVSLGACFYVMALCRMLAYVRGGRIHLVCTECRKAFNMFRFSYIKRDRPPVKCPVCQSTKIFPKEALYGS